MRGGGGVDEILKLRIPVALATAYELLREWYPRTGTHGRNIPALAMYAMYTMYSSLETPVQVLHTVHYRTEYEHLTY